MNRLQRFLDNAGGRGSVLAILVVAALAIVIRKDFREGTWPYVLLPVLLCFGVAYVVRDVLVRNVRATQVVMKVALLLAVTAAVLLPQWEGSDPLWFRALYAAFFGTYMGCYFWLLSDERVGRK